MNDRLEFAHDENNPNYRDTGLLGYVQLPGKIIYRESDIRDLLDRHYRK